MSVCMCVCMCVCVCVLACTMFLWTYVRLMMGCDGYYRKLDSCHVLGPMFVRVCVSERLCVLVCTCVHECESAYVCAHHSFHHQFKEKITSNFRFNQNLSHVTII